MKVLIIENDPEIAEAISLCFQLRWSEAQIVSCNQGLIAIDLMETEFPDIIILDIGLPDIDGFEVCRRIRRFSDAPIVMLTARDHEYDKVKGLELGADDYITKPFSHVELLARAKSVLRRSTMPTLDKGEDPLTVGNVAIDFNTHEVLSDGAEVRLTPTEYSLLCVLARNAGRVIPQQVLLQKVWGSDFSDADDYLKVYIQRLRAKLGDDSLEPALIVCERGVGYKLNNPGQDQSSENSSSVSVRKDEDESRFPRAKIQTVR
ncbi:MAG: response regulator transcription factor [Dehalococcoidia bacterium]|nr:response regulator transcription factor [Dehalococcoidia bacterium]